LLNILDFNFFSYFYYMHTPDQDNLNFQLAADFVNNTNRPIFLTGKAGTGKTTFLKYIKETTKKQTAVVAPTGVAAINAGGATMHSFFTLPFGPFIPGTKKGFGGDDNEQINDKHSLISRMRYNREKKEVLQSLELLIIDEVSMVRSDVIDAIDLILRYFRRNFNEPFGGVQVLFIGDMYQLAPVVKEDEWKLLQEYYDSPYFFDSLVLKQSQPLYIELEKIYRQNEQNFIDVLNQVRNNQLNEQGMALLNSRYQPNFMPAKTEGYITLTTHNFKADGINENELAGLSGRNFSFKAVVDREFNEKSFPADLNLHLKMGAQVMFIKNDVAQTRKYYNGKIGTVARIDEKENKIYVICKDSDDEIEVKKETWKNIRYSVNKQEQKVDEEEIGSFTQYPLRLAWAITIHKSQGLTFEKAIIDAGSAFAPGQVYVALSRCTSLQGMVLHSKVTATSVFSDKRIHQFAAQKPGSALLKPHLDEAKKDYQSKLLLGLFNFENIIKEIVAVEKVIHENLPSFDEDGIAFVQRLNDDTYKLKGYADKFIPQLQALLVQPGLPEENTELQTRIKSAAAWFAKYINDFLLMAIDHSPVVTDSRTHGQTFDAALGDLKKQTLELFRLMECCQQGFSVNEFLRTRSRTQIGQLASSSYAGSAQAPAKIVSPHPILFKQLQNLRNVLCQPKNLPIYFVAASNTLQEMARFLPQNMEELGKINGMGKVKLAAYGEAFLEVIKKYAADNKLISLIHEKNGKPLSESDKKYLKPDTKSVSYELFKAGKTITEIAAERRLTYGTIETHLAHFVLHGDIKIEEILMPLKIEVITKVYKEIGGTSTVPIKQVLGDDVSFSEVRLVMDWLQKQEVGAATMETSLAK